MSVYDKDMDAEQVSRIFFRQMRQLSMRKLDSLDYQFSDRHM